MSRPEQGPLAIHHAALAEGELLLQRSASSGNWVYPPRTAAPGTGVADLSWEVVSGRGTVYAVTVVSRSTEKGGNYNIALVELDEGPRMMTRVVNIAPDRVGIGMIVRACIESPDFGPLAGTSEPVVLFEPDDTGAR